MASRAIVKIQGHSDLRLAFNIWSEGSTIWQCLRTRKSERVRGRRPEGMNEDSSRRTGLLSGEKALDATEGRRMLKEKGVR